MESLKDKYIKLLFNKITINIENLTENEFIPKKVNTLYSWEYVKNYLVKNLMILKFSLII